MSTKTEKRLTWFKFFPSDFLDIMRMNDKQVADRFRELIERLLKNSAPEGTPEAEMIADSLAFCERQRERITNYWKQRNGDADSREATDESTTVSAAPSVTRRPPRQPIPSPTKPKKPSLEEVYDYCDTIGTPPPIGREWYEWQDSKGWNKFTSTWQAAFRAFAKKKEKQQ